jgi:drug/metabolite transporter (DMT)-like permease
MFYLSALFAILGGLGYQFFIKRVPAGLNPFVNVMAIYLVVIVLCLTLLPLFPVQGKFTDQVRQLSWIHIVLAISVTFIEIGFLLMYRYGWNLSTGNLVTGVVINVILAAIGLWFLGEKLNPVNLLGIALSVLGVALIGYRSN